MTDDKDLPLPTPAWARDFHGEAEVFTADQMRQYARLAAQQARRQALEEAADIAATPVAGEQDDITMAAKDRIADAVRALMAQDGPA
jgi:hypothetical protein